ncbi:MAG: mitofilin family membrane protein [Pseudomonadota bacterium]
MTTESSSDETAASATERVIALFGGVRPMAAKLEISASTIQGWKERDNIPEARHADILAAAAKHDIALDPSELSDPKQAEPEPDQTSAAGPETPPPPAESDTSPSDTKPASDTPKPSPEAPSATPPPSPPIPPTPVPPPSGQLGRRNARALTVAIVALVIGIAGLIWAVVDGETEGTSSLASRVAALEARPEPQPVDLSGIESRLSALEAEVGSQSDASGTQDLVDQLSALSDRVAALEQAASGDQSDALAQQLQALGDRVGALEQADPSDQITALSQQVQTLSDTTTTLQATVSGLQESQATLRAALQALPTAEMLNNTSSSIDERLSAFQTQIDQALAIARQNTGQGPALVLAVSQLRDTIDSGADYASALAAVTSLASGDGSLTQPLGVLGQHADTGVPTFDTLTEEFSAVANAIREAARPQAEGWFDSALNSVGSLVTVRRAPGENDGDDADAVTARAEARVAAGNWTGAEQALSDLSGAPAEAAEDWLSALQAKLAVDQALSSVQTAAIDALASTQ